MAKLYPEASVQQPSDFSRLREQAGLSIEQLATRVGFSVRTVYRWERGEATPRTAALHVLRELVSATRPPAPDQPGFRFIDLFAGIGGLRRGFEPLGGKCVFTSEWDRYAQLTYRANYETEHELAGDIRQVPVGRIPAHDVLLAGFPCQPFSIAGVSKKNALNRPHGFRCEAQGTLFFHLASIIERRRPKVFLLENVKNLVSHDRGRTFDVISRTLTEELGYQIHWKVIDARSWVPQHRERIFIVGFREPNGFTFDDLDIPDPQNGPRLKSVLHPEDGTEPHESAYIEGPRGRVRERYTLTNHLWSYLRAYAEKHRAKGNGFGFGLADGESVTRTLSARYFKDGSEILVAQQQGNPRRLTPRECARLMGFDASLESRFRIPVSDTQAYKQFGNAVVVPVVRAVARAMAPWIDGATVDPASLQRRLPAFG
jgi:DNA (cytosine-5)-methyltransferase 1